MFKTISLNYYVDFTTCYEILGEFVAASSNGVLSARRVMSPESSPSSLIPNISWWGLCHTDRSKRFLIA
jgi:hypothetical protein